MMSRRRTMCVFTLRLLCVAALVVPMQTQAGADSAPAVLIAASGPVTVLRGGTEISGTFGLPLQVGDEVRTGEGGSAQVLFEAGNVVGIGPNSNIQIQGRPKAEAAAETDAGESPAANRNIEVVQNFIRLKNREGTSTLSRLRSGNDAQDLVAVSPGRTRIRTDRPDFSWKIKDASTELQLTVYTDDGVLWKRTVSGTSMKYPDDAPALEPGVSYSWAVETTDPLLMPPLRSKAVFFEVITNDDAKALDDALAGISEDAEPNASSYHLIRASLFFDGGLLEDAIAETEGALKSDPTNTGLRSILARLYAEVGRPDDALAEFDRIIESQ